MQFADMLMGKKYDPPKGNIRINRCKDEVRGPAKPKIKTVMQAAGASIVLFRAKHLFDVLLKNDEKVVYGCKLERDYGVARTTARTYIEALCIEGMLKEISDEECQMIDASVWSNNNNTKYFEVIYP